jgi:uncharacterized protein
MSKQPAVNWCRPKMLVLFSITLSTVLTLVVGCCLVATVLGIPGNWGIMVVAGVTYWLVPKDYLAHTPAVMVLVLLGLALVGEAIEFAAGALGVGKLGGSKRSAALAVVGSLVGAIAGMFVGLPIPIVGSLIASVLLGGVGALAGAALGERWVGKDWHGSLEVGFAAFWGKLLGTFGKVVCGAIMAGIAIFLLWSP